MQLNETPATATRLEWEAPVLESLGSASDVHNSPGGGLDAALAGSTS